MAEPHYIIPTRAQVADLKVGDTAIDCFGAMAKVVEITCRKDDISGKLFVCYYTETGPGSRCSMSLKEGELARTVKLSVIHTSAELDAIERRLLAA